MSSTALIASTPTLQKTALSTHAIPHKMQLGVSLIDLLVGVAIGLLIITIAMGALLASRSVSGTVSDSAQLQQQASHAFRVIGQQLRATGSARLNLASQKSATDNITIADPVVFEAIASDFNPRTDSLSGLDTPSDNEYKLSVGYRNYKESLTTGLDSQMRNCLGEQNSETLIRSNFSLRDFQLFCAGSTTAQPIIENVANFEVRYLLQTTPSGTPRIQYVNAATVAANNDWDKVIAIEVCLTLFGSEPIDLPAGSTYINCAGDAISLTDASVTPSPRTRRMHMTFRNLYQLRSQGLSALAF